MQAEEENQQILFNHVEDEVAKNSRLVSENERLKDQLENLAHGTASTFDAIPDQKKVVGSTNVHADEHRDLVNKYNKLNRKFQDLSQKMKYLERKNNAVMQKNKDMKESVRAWQDYADRQSGRQKPKNDLKVDGNRSRLSTIPHIDYTRPHMPSSPGSVATVRRPFSLADTERSSPAPSPPLEHREGDPEPEVSPRANDCHKTVDARSPSGSLTPKPSISISLHSTQQKESVNMPPMDAPSNSMSKKTVNKHLQSYLHTVNLSSSQTTEDENSEHAIRHAQYTQNADDDEKYDDDEMPQFVSARSLKRKRSLSSRVDFHRDRSLGGTTVRPIRVKDEQFSSPPITHGLFRKETIDLDVPTLAVLQTPRHIKSRSPMQPYHQRSSSAPIIQEIKQEDARSGQAEEALNNETVLGEPDSLKTGLQAHSGPSDQSETKDHILGTLHPNTSTSHHEARSKEWLKGAETHRQDINSIFAEAREEPQVTERNATRLTPSVARAKLNEKMQGSSGLSTCKSPGSIPSRIEVEQNPTPPTTSARRMVHTPLARVKLGHPQTESGPSNLTTDDRPQWRMKAPETRPGVRKSALLPPRQQSQLRSKPISQLSVQDFRPNPVYNQGYTYAFSETVRKRSDRLCLPGCTNPQCCGSTFRTFAEAQAPLTPSQEEALLEDYLGDAYNNGNMTQMSTDERQELILQARTKKLAKDSGKHREAYERRQTPPGYWRVDFPTTQELRQDRDRAKELEKKAVQDRWLEAQRKGGRWIFRDE
jgi:cell division protein FtsB